MLNLTLDKDNTISSKTAKRIAPFGFNGKHYHSIIPLKTRYLGIIFSDKNKIAALVPGFLYLAKLLYLPV
jgi:hypothetical protein